MLYDIISVLEKKNMKNSCVDRTFVDQMAPVHARTMKELVF
jgi:hypothetical protein